MSSAQLALDLDFSVVRGGPLYKIRRMLGLIPDKGLGIARRILFIVGFAWLPTFIGAILAGQAFEGQEADPLLRHFGVHARLLISVPLLILAEGVMERAVKAVVHHFVASGLIDPEELPKFRTILQESEKFRDSWIGKALVLAAIIGGAGAAAVDPSGFGHELSWAETGPPADRHLEFAGWWFVFVGRPIFAAMLALWLWRLIVIWRLMSRISKLDLRLVPSHPDRAGGLGFVQLIVSACAPIVLAMSAVLAGRWAHDMKYHGMSVDALQPLVAAFLVVTLLIFLGPLLMFAGNLHRFKRKSMLQYATLTGQQGMLIHDKWVQGRDIGSPAVLNAPEIGPMADAITLYGAVANMRSVPFGKHSIVQIALAALLPMIPVFAIQVPIKELLLKLAKGLI